MLLDKVERLSELKVNWPGIPPPGITYTNLGCPLTSPEELSEYQYQAPCLEIVNTGVLCAPGASSVLNTQR